MARVETRPSAIAYYRVAFRSGCRSETRSSTQGCTPGDWKQPHHFGNWIGYNPGDSFETVSGVDYPNGDPTLLQALKKGGGGFYALGRHAVAALLNTAHPDVDYSPSTGALIAYIQANWPTTKAGANALKKELQAINELGCPLGRAP